MFYLTYLHRELRRRPGRTVLTVVGLAVGASLVVLVAALSTGVDRAQSKVLDPLAKVGTDLVVSRPADVPLSGTGVVGGVDEAELSSLVAENQPLFQTDFAALGRPGQAFERDLLLPSTQLTFPVDQVAKLSRLDGVDDVAGALTLVAVHQKGRIPAPPVAPAPPLPPGEVIKRVLNPPQSDLASEPYTAAGVDTAKPRLGLITASQVVTGRFLNAGARDEVVLAETYARRHDHRVGSRLAVAGKSYAIVGTVRPELGTTSADVYLDLAELQRLSGHTARVNALLVRADTGADTAALTKGIERVFPGASVRTSKQLADSITGSLVSAGPVGGGIGVAIGAAAVVAAVVVAVALTLSSVARRVRELGTLAALGWSPRLVRRQVFAESFTQGVFGAVLGVALGALAAFALDRASISLNATASVQPGPLSTDIGLGRVLSETASEAIVLTAPLRPAALAAAVAVGLGGGLLAGIAGGLRAARLRPADALREVR